MRAVTGNSPRIFGAGAAICQRHEFEVKQEAQKGALLLGSVFAHAARS